MVGTRDGMGQDLGHTQADRYDPYKYVNVYQFSVTR